MPGPEAWLGYALLLSPLVVGAAIVALLWVANLSEHH